MTREEAREYFNNRLAYRDIHVEELEDLQSRLSEKVVEFSSGERVDRIRRKDKRFVRQRLLHARLYTLVNDCHRMELVGFNPSGYIQLFNSFDYEHADALLPVFTEWVDYVYKHK